MLNLLNKKRTFAAIDIGTNSFHLAIMQSKKDGKLKLLDRKKVVLRLGSQNKGISNLISEDEFLTAINTLTDFKLISEKYDAEIITVATSALREADNKFDFIQRVKQQTGIEINLIAGDKEAELEFLGISYSIDTSKNNILSLDIGGGSTEFIFSENGRIVYVNSLKLGAVRLSNLFFNNFILDDDSVAKCIDYTNKTLDNNLPSDGNYNFHFAIAASGTANSAAQIISAKRNGRDSALQSGFTFYKEELDSLVKSILTKKTVQERLQVIGMDEKRADILPAGLLLFQAILDKFQIEKVLISDTSLREGMVIDRVNNLKAIKSF